MKTKLEDFVPGQTADHLSTNAFATVATNRNILVNLLLSDLMGANQYLIESVGNQDSLKVRETFADSYGKVTILDLMGMPDLTDEEIFQMVLSLMGPECVEAKNGQITAISKQGLKYITQVMNQSKEFYENKLFHTVGKSFIPGKKDHFDFKNTQDVTDFISSTGSKAKKPAIRAIRCALLKIARVIHAVNTNKLELDKLDDLFKDIIKDQILDKFVVMEKGIDEKEIQSLNKKIMERISKSISVLPQQTTSSINFLKDLNPIVKKELKKRFKLENLYKYLGQKIDPEEFQTDMVYCVINDVFNSDEMNSLIKKHFKKSVDKKKYLELKKTLTSILARDIMKGFFRFRAAELKRTKIKKIGDVEKMNFFTSYGDLNELPLDKITGEVKFNMTGRAKSDDRIIMKLLGRPDLEIDGVLTDYFGLKSNIKKPKDAILLLQYLYYKVFDQSIVEFGNKGMIKLKDLEAAKDQLNPEFYAKIKKEFFPNGDVDCDSRRKNFKNIDVVGYIQHKGEIYPLEWQICLKDHDNESGFGHHKIYEGWEGVIRANVRLLGYAPESYIKRVALKILQKDEELVQRFGQGDLNEAVQVVSRFFKSKFAELNIPGNKSNSKIFTILKRWKELYHKKEFYPQCTSILTDDGWINGATKAV